MANEVSRLPGGLMISIKIDTFGGLNTVNREQSLQLGELIIAKNVEITRLGKVVRRYGYESLDSGSWHSVFGSNGINLGVLNNDLVSVDSAWATTTIIQGIGSTNVSYVNLNNRVYLTNTKIIGWVEDDVFSSFGEPIGDLKIRPIPGQLIEYFAGRLFVAVGNAILYSDVGHFGDFDLKSNFKQLPSTIKMMRATAGGIYLSDENKTYFMKGESANKFKLVELFNFPVVPGTDVTFDASIIKNDNLLKGNNFGKAIVWTGYNGICVGTGDGDVVNKTERNYVIPDEITGGSAVLINDAERGSVKYVASVW